MASLFKAITCPAARLVPAFVAVCFVMSAFAVYGADDTLKLDDVIAEALKNNPEILAAQARAQAAGYRVPQAKALPDPMFMVGYQNMGFERLNLGEEEDAMGMLSASQTIPFPGKRRIRGEAASRDAESVTAVYNATKLNVIARTKEAFYDLFLAYKTLDTLKERAELFSRIEDAATARYSSGTGSQQEVVMAQAEKYLILEREELQRQQIQALQGLLNSIIGRDVNSPLGRPSLLSPTAYSLTLEQSVAAGGDESPEVRSKKKLIEAAEARVRLAKRNYYPDFTIGANYFPRTNGFVDMWSVTTSVNIPLYYRSKQRQALLEAEAALSEAKRELLVTNYALSSGIRENFSIMQSADRLMTLYKEGLIPKTNQDVQLAFSNYVTGRVDALTVITRIKNLLDTDLLYWNQFVEREKAIARLVSFVSSGRGGGLAMKTAGMGSQAPAARGGAGGGMSGGMR